MRYIYLGVGVGIEEYTCGIADVGLLYVVQVPYDISCNVFIEPYVLSASVSAGGAALAALDLTVFKNYVHVKLVDIDPFGILEIENDRLAFLLVYNKVTGRDSSGAGRNETIRAVSLLVYLS